MGPDNFLSLLNRARAGDRQAIDELLSGVRPWLEQQAHRFADPEQPDASVSDLVQQAWLKAWQSLAQFQGAADDEQAQAMFRGWLGTIVHRLGLNAVRDRKAQVRHPGGKMVRLDALTEDRIDPPGSEPSPSAGLTLEEQIRRVRESLAKIPDAADREIIRLRFFEGKSLRQIAEKLRLNHETVRQRYHAVLRHLERELGGLL